MARGRKNKNKAKGDSRRDKFIAGLSLKNTLKGAGARIVANQIIPKVVPFGMQGPAEQAAIGLVMSGQRHFLKVAAADAAAIAIKRLILPRLMGITANGGVTPIGTAAGQYIQSVTGAVSQE